MKKSILIFSTVVLSSTALFAQQPVMAHNMPPQPSINATPPSMPQTPPAQMQAPVSPAQMQTPAAPALNPDLSMKFVSDDHNFGTVPEGPTVSYEYEFKNIGKTPITLSDVKPSCGCTTPVWSKEPILPGKSSKITATFATQGRPGPSTKQITVMSNVGTKVIKFKVNVEKSPDASVPANNNSMMKH
jgi:hypothetical protein